MTDKVLPRIENGKIILFEQHYDDMVEDINTLIEVIKSVIDESNECKTCWETECELQAALKK